MRFLLDRHGIKADASGSADLVAVIEQKRADVVILDASGSLLAAAREAAAAKALHPRVEIVVVAENGTAEGSTTSPSTTSGRAWTASSNGLGLAGGCPRPSNRPDRPRD